MWPSTRRQFFYCRRHARYGRVRAVIFCIVVGMPVLAEYAPSVFAFSWRPSWPSIWRQFLHCRRHARRGRVRAVSFCILVRTSGAAEYTPSVFAFPLVLFFLSSFDFFVYFSSFSSTHLHHASYPPAYPAPARPIAFSLV